MGDKIVIHTGKSSGFTNTHQNSKAVSNRLSRAIGHLESIRRMVEDGRDCTEVLVQLSAVKSAVNNAGKLNTVLQMRFVMEICRYWKN